MSVTKWIGLASATLCVGHTIHPGLQSNLSAVTGAFLAPSWPSPSLRAKFADASAAKLLAQGKITQVEREGLLFYLATGTSTAREKRVQELVRQCLRSADEGRDALPEALLLLAERGRSSQAFHELMVLRLDGGPAETLAAERLKLAQDFPERIGHYLRSKYRTAKAACALRGRSFADPFIDSLRFALEDEDASRAQLYRAIERNRSSDSLFLKSIVELAMKRKY